MQVDSERLRTCLKIIRTQSADELNVIPQDDGWKMVAVSPDHVTIASVTLSPSGFPDGYVKSEPFCVNLPMFADILAGVKGSCDIDTSSGKIVIKAGGYTYRKPLYAPQAELPKVPNPATDTEVMLSADLMAEFLTKAQKTAGTSAVRITAAPGSLALSAEDESGNGLSLVIPADRCAILEGEASVMYPLEEWTNFVKALPADAEMDIHFATDFPAMVTCTDGVYSAGWLCAPRIED